MFSGTVAIDRVNLVDPAPKPREFIPPNFGENIPPSKNTHLECPYEVDHTYHFCGACLPAFIALNHVKIGLHLTKLGRPKNLEDSPKKLPIGVPAESRF